MTQVCEDRNETGTVLIGVGANLPDRDGCSPLDTCRRAVAMLDALPGLRLTGLSRWYETAPVPPSGQPPYINAVAALSGQRIDPVALLVELMAIETKLGRERGLPDAARTLDLDIVAIGGLIRAAPNPVLPHPRAHLRAFVLAPLAEVAPWWIHPVLGRTAAALLADLSPQAIRAL